MKDWISTVLLVSFLRLQVVCCCGSVVHCDTDSSFADRETHAVGRHSVNAEDPIVAKQILERETAGKSNRSKCSCTKHHGKLASSTCKIETNAKRGSINKPSPICGCGHRDCDEHAHHLYWLSHGSVVPESKMGSHNSVLVQSFDRSFSIAANDVCLKSCLGNSLPAFPPPDLLSLLGHRRI